MKIKRQWTEKEIKQLLRENGYTLVKGRGKGTHHIYINQFGNIISIPKSNHPFIIERLIKENNLQIGEA